MHKGESRLAMALEGGDVRVRPHETCQSRSVALSDVKRAKRRQKTRQIPRRCDLPQSGCPTASEHHWSAGSSRSRSRRSEAPKPLPGTDWISRESDSPGAVIVSLLQTVTGPKLAMKEEGPDGQGAAGPWYTSVRLGP